MKFDIWYRIWVEVEQCTVGDKGPIAPYPIFSAYFGLPNSVQLAATTWSGQIWISGWILPHFDVRTISVAWKLKELPNIFWQQIFFLLDPLCKGLVHCWLGRSQKYPLTEHERHCKSSECSEIILLSVCILYVLPEQGSSLQARCVTTLERGNSVCKL